MKLLKQVLVLALMVFVLQSFSFAIAVPSTFGTTVGHTILCLNQLDSAYFYGYFSDAFGPAYKHEGGAYWFKAQATLWGSPISEVMVSDGNDTMAFVGAVADITPEKLDEAIVTSTGIRHVKKNDSSFPVRQANPGSQIVYFKTKSKIFCSKSQFLLPN